MKYLIIGIICALVALALFVLFFVFVKKKQVPDSPAALIFAIVFSFMSVMIMRDYQKPHHGECPKLDDVPENAHINTIKIIQHSDTTEKYTIKWNDEF